MTAPPAGAPAGSAPVADRPRRDRPDRRTVGIALGVVAGVLLLLWALDSLARYGASTLVARAVQQQTGVQHLPQVHLHGLFFVPQVVRGSYSRVDVDVADVSSGPLRLAQVHAELRGVHLAFHDVLVRDVHRVVVDRSTERAQLTYDDLNRYLKVTGRSVAVERAEQPGQLQLTGTVTVLGQRVSASAAVGLSAQQGAIAVRPRQVQTDITGLDDTSRLLLGQRFTVLVPLQALPFGQRVTSVAVRDDRLLIDAEGQSVVVQD